MVGRAVGMSTVSRATRNMLRVRAAKQRRFFQFVGEGNGVVGSVVVFIVDESESGSISTSFGHMLTWSVFGYPMLMICNDSRWRVVWRIYPTSVIWADPWVKASSGQIVLFRLRVDATEVDWKVYG